MSTLRRSIFSKMKTCRNSKTENLSLEKHKKTRSGGWKLENFTGPGHWTILVLDDSSFPQQYVLIFKFMIYYLLDSVR